jgi:hypothetical protein
MELHPVRNRSVVDAAAGHWDNDRDAKIDNDRYAVKYNRNQI